jgi:hypothetical protein
MFECEKTPCADNRHPGFCFVRGRSRFGVAFCSDWFATIGLLAGIKFSRA